MGLNGIVKIYYEKSKKKQIFDIMQIALVVRITLYSKYMSRASNSSPTRIARMIIHTGTKNRLSGLLHITVATTCMKACLQFRA